MMPDFDIDIRHHPIVFGTRNNIQVHVKMHLFSDMPWSMVESAYSSIRMLVDPEHSLRKGLHIDIQGSKYHLLAIACWTHVHWPAFICFPHPAVHYAIFADFQHALRVAHLIGSAMDKFWKVASCNLQFVIVICQFSSLTEKFRAAVPAKPRKRHRDRNDWGGGWKCGLYAETMMSVFKHPTSKQALRLMLSDPAQVVLISCAQGFHRTGWLLQLYLVAWPLPLSTNFPFIESLRALELELDVYPRWQWQW